jgi:hypothetical protein
VYNPGSSEAACSSDFSFKRGAFLVTISKEDKYVKEVEKLQLTNRTHRWETICFKTEFRKKDKMYEYIIHKLKGSLNLDEYCNKNPSDIHIPVLFLVLKGRKPFYRIKIDKKEITETLCQNLPVVDVRIYQKFSDFLTKIDTFI